MFRLMSYCTVLTPMNRFFKSTFLQRFRRQKRIPSIKVIALIVLIAGTTVIAGISIGFHLFLPPTLRQFSDYQELVGFVQTSRPPVAYWGFDTFASMGTERPTTFSGTSGYSSTNVQVQGVDEPDIVKTDGTNIYTVGVNTVSVIQAYPVETAEIVNTITPIGKPLKLFLYNSAYLIIISGVVEETWLHSSAFWDQYSLHYIDTVAVEIFDVRNTLEIQRTYWITLEGAYLGSRLVDRYLYFLGICQTQENDTILLPHLEVNGQEVLIPAKEIYYDPDNRDYSFQYTVLLGLDIVNPDAEPSKETILGGSSSATVYASLNNVYLAISQYAAWTIPPQESTTAIHRFSIEQGTIDYQASGEVPGHLINQFALDEFSGLLRVATESIVTSSQLIRDSYTNQWIIQYIQTQLSNVFVLDKQLNVVGSLRGLAPGEQIYSTRFLGTTCYLVTFYKTDPLFVIDLSNPFKPQLLGELIIPGYSDYLHPLGDNLLLGIGKDVAISASEDFWWYQGVKLSLFNSSDPFHPEEATNLILGVRGTTSPALDDHKAVLIDTSRCLLVLPILLAEYLYDSPHHPSETGDFVYQGAYIFHLNPTNATIDIRGRITHIENSSILNDYWGGWNPYFIERALYINEILYAFSPYKLTFHTLDNLEFQGELILNPELNGTL